MPRAAVALAFEKIDAQAKKDLERGRDRKHLGHCFVADDTATSDIELVKLAKIGGLAEKLQRLSRPRDQRNLDITSAGGTGRRCTDKRYDFNRVVIAVLNSRGASQK